jgi:hypothetical protein
MARIFRPGHTDVRIFGPGLTVALVAFGACGSPPAQYEATPPVTFHHVHLRVADPAAEMERLARLHGCEKTIVQGAGAGVRCGRAFVLFERDTTPATGTPMAGDVRVEGRGADAVILVRVATSDGAAARRRIDLLAPGAAGAVTLVGADAIPTPATLAHVAFAVTDTADVTARVAAAGARTLLATTDRVVAETPEGLIVELLHDDSLLRPGEDVERRDTFWCPMHPDVRSRGAGTCPLCAMALVPVPPLTVGEYTFDVTADENRRLTLRVRDPHTGAPVTAFHLVHERLLHLFVINRNLTYFAHEHPTPQSDGRFTIDLHVPRPDVYLLVADVTPAGGTPQMLRHFWVSPDFRGRPFVPRDALATGIEPRTSGTLRASLGASAFVAGRRSEVTFSLADVRTRQPVTDLESYLGAAGHLVVASADLADVVHSHPTSATTAGPEIGFEVTFPRAGRYKLWAQFQRGGQVETVAFVVDVS